MATITFFEIIERTLERAGTPLSVEEIWKKAKEYEFTGDKIYGKTPWATIGSKCYVDIANNKDNSTIIQTSIKPAKFYLRRLSFNMNVEAEVIPVVTSMTNTDQSSINKIETPKFNERDLHPLVVSYANISSHFNAHLKTIFHEASIKKTKGENEWLHPDLVGVHFPFDDYIQSIQDVQAYMNVNSIKLFSFELKKSLHFGNLRESFFQAVSNSSWATEGYLVALTIDNNIKLIDEIRRLNNAHGIGLIKINAANVYESEIIFPSRINVIDWDTANRLAKENSDFDSFQKSIAEDCKLGKIKSQYDKIQSPEYLEKYIAEKGIA